MLREKGGVKTCLPCKAPSTVTCGLRAGDIDMVLLGSVQQCSRKSAEGQGHEERLLL